MGDNRLADRAARPRDVLIRGGLVVDGSGAEPYLADIWVRKGKIAGVGASMDRSEDALVIDAAGKYVTPGFVDIHRHSDLAVFREDFGQAERAQGITAVVSGNCGLAPYPCAPEYRAELTALLTPIMGEMCDIYADGGSVLDGARNGGRPALDSARVSGQPAPEDARASAPSAASERRTLARFASFSDYLAYLQSHLDARQRTPGLPPLPYLGHLIGSCAIRIAVKGLSPTPFTDREMDRAVGYIGEAMDAGALGLSMGLMYEPEYFSSRDELLTLARAAAAKNGVLTCHIRGEGDSLAASVREAADIAERAGIALQLSHFKSCGVRNWGVEIYKAIEWIERRRRAGADIHADCYPYTGGATSMLSLFPPGFMRAGLVETRRLLDSPEGARRLERMLSRPIPGWDNYIESLGFERIVLSSVKRPHNRRFIGRAVGQIPEAQSDPYAFLCRLMADEACEVGVTVMSMAQSDVDAVARLPWTMFVSDALYPAAGLSHPRAYGAFSRVLRELVREREVLTLPGAVRKMTALPAEKLRLEGRGRLRAGCWADVCVFNLEKVKDNAGWENPARLAEGLDTVLVRGRMA